MVYFSIRAHCLAQQYEWKKEYGNIHDLKKDIFDYFQVYNLNEECSLIVYYDEKDKCDRIFDSLPTDSTSVLDLYVKRIWTCCCICFGPFDITPDRLPLECNERTCNVQYCVKCVNIICELDKNHKFTCTSCNKNSDRPQRNILLENTFLWKPYTMRYGGQSIERLETIFNGPNLSDTIRRIENHRTHIQALQKTLKQCLATIRDRELYSDDDNNQYLLEADRLNDQLETFIKRLKLCERKIKVQPVTLRGLINNYRTTLRDAFCQRPSKQEAGSFILLCEKLSASNFEAIEYIKTTNEQLIVSKPNLIAMYRADRLKNIVVKECIAFVNDILDDIGYRRDVLQGKQQLIAELYLTSANHPFRTFYFEQHQDAISMIASLNDYETQVSQFRDIYNEIEEIMHEYKDQLSKKTFDQTPNDHMSLPTSDQMMTFECSRLILVSELLRSETERLEMETIFPQVTKLVHQWKQHQDIDPKIYDLFVALEQDLLTLYDPRQTLINLIPFRVGFIGNINVGKSSLVNHLRALNAASISTDRTSSPTAVGQSTVGSLQFDEQHRCPTTQTIVTIRYVDIEGCNDYHTKVQAASYFEQIQKADCDLYIILFTGQQVTFERHLEQEIDERLNRPCWFVRSKVDKEFEEHFNEQITRRKRDYPDMILEGVEENELAEQIIEMIREKTMNICQTSAEQLFLINSTYSDSQEHNDRYFKSKTHPFDLNILSEQLINAAKSSFAQERIKRMGTMVCARAIGTCFRQRCIISFISHQVRAGISAMLLPWGDQLALVHIRFGIRLALGVQDRPYLYSLLLKKVDVLESLLLKYPLNIAPDNLKSDEFNYLKVHQSSLMNSAVNDQYEYRKTIHLGREPRQRSSITGKLSSAMPTGTVACSLIGQKIAATTIAVGSLSYGIGAGLFGLCLLASIPIGLWKQKKSGQHIRNYLDDLCADLLIISEHYLAAIISEQTVYRE